MCQNKVQFQKGISLPDFIKQYGTESRCVKALEQLKWPNGFQCERCGNHKYNFIKSRAYYQCADCKHQTSLIRGTLFHSTKLPLTKWFLSIYLITQSKNGISALELKRQIGVSYKTAWSVKHKITQVMTDQEAKTILSGIIEIDDAYLGGKRKGKRGRGAEGKMPFLAAVETDLNNKPMKMVLSVVDGFNKRSIEYWSKTHLQSGSFVVSDGLACFKSIKFSNCLHWSQKPGEGQKTTDLACFKWVNTVLGNLKNSIKGTYKSNKQKYVQRYLSEFQYRFNRRFDLKGMIDDLLKSLFFSKPIKVKTLRLDVNCN